MMSARVSLSRPSVGRFIGRTDLGELLLLRSQLLGSPLRHSLGAGRGVHDPVPPPEAARVVPNELLVVHIMVIRARPEGNKVVQTPWQVISRVRIDGLEETQHDPDVHRQDVEVASESSPCDGCSDRTETEEEDFDG